jgi:hypothetical protein
MMQKLPKQWKHWCRMAGLKPHSNRPSRERSEWAWWYLQGRGRYWRINDKGMFQCGDTYAEFDRWALCDIEQEPRPNSMSEFSKTVAVLLNRKSSNVKCPS